MKQTVKTSRTAGYLEKIFRACNEHYFNGELTEPIITVSPTAGAYGHCSVNKIWSKSTGETVREINISSESFDRPIEEIVATMIHEMVHLYHTEKGIQDCSRNFTYHNKIFKEKAEQCDLRIEKHPTYGWTITYPTDKLMEFILSQGWSEIAMSRAKSYAFGIRPPKGGNGTDATEPPVKAKTSWRWHCPKCGIIVRSTKDLTGKIRCVDCDEIMIE